MAVSINTQVVHLYERAILESNRQLFRQVSLKYQYGLIMFSILLGKV